LIILSKNSSSIQIDSNRVDTSNDDCAVDEEGEKMKWKYREIKK